MMAAAAALNDAARLWAHVFGDQPHLLALFSGYYKPETRRLEMPSTRFYTPDRLEDALAWAAQQDGVNREVYFCAHQLLGEQRTKEQAAPLWTLFADVDSGNVDDSPIRPTAVVESSPGHAHVYARLRRPIAPAQAERLNRRWTLAFGADPSGFDLSQVLRVPSTHNRKYAGAPLVHLRYIDNDTLYDPDELERLLPPLPERVREKSQPATFGDEPPVRLYGRALELWHGEGPWTDPDDRSASLVRLAHALARANATQATIGEALADRDVALEWRKFSDRPDGPLRYAEIATMATGALGQDDDDDVEESFGDPEILPAPAKSWPEPENRGRATLSEQGTIQYVDDLIRPGRIVVWAAEEGAGKSFAVSGELGIRLAVAGGKFADTWPIVQRGGVLVLSEMHADDDYEREATILRSLDLTRASLDGCYWRLGLMTAAHGKPCLRQPEWRTWCIDWCRDNAVKTIIVDTATGATDVDPWGRDIQAVYRELHGLLDAYPQLAIVLIVHCKKPQGHGERRITDVIGEWGRWCDVVVLQERDGMTRTKLTTFKRVRHQRRIVATQRDGLLVEPMDVSAGREPKVPLERVVATIGAEPGLTVAELAAKLTVSKRTASGYVATAVDNGQAFVEPTGPRNALRVFPTAQRADDGNVVVARSLLARSGGTAQRAAAIYSCAVTSCAIVDSCQECGEPLPEGTVGVCSACYTPGDEARE